MKRRTKKTKTIGLIDEYVKINRKLSREEEIRQHGVPIRICSIHRSKKTYNRNQYKRELKSSLFLFRLN